MNHYDGKLRGCLFCYGLKGKGLDTVFHSEQRNSKIAVLVINMTEKEENSMVIIEEYWTNVSWVA